MADKKACDKCGYVRCICNRTPDWLNELHERYKEGKK